jgi:hypothetical protein
MLCPRVRIRWMRAEWCTRTAKEAEQQDCRNTMHKGTIMQVSYTARYVMPIGHELVMVASIHWNHVAASVALYGERYATLSVVGRHTMTAACFLQTVL